MVTAANSGNLKTKTPPDPTLGMLASLSDHLQKTQNGKMSLADFIGVAELLTSALQPLLKRIDITLQSELKSILDRIESLRSEIASVRADDIANNHIPEMGRELSAVVESTEAATNTIMAAAEAIMAGDPTNIEEYTTLVSNNVTEIFQACSFQDLTGQRVTKVVETIEIIEERINILCNMLDFEASDSEQSSKEQRKAERRNAEGRKKDPLLNGPARRGEGVAQDDIDKMF